MERDKMRVLDASVIYKWYVEEGDSDKALSLRNDFKDKGIGIAVPDFLFHELANSLRYNPNLSKEEIEETIDNLAELDLDVIMTAPIFTKDAVRLAYEYQITVYDALYLALAKDLEFEFITADRKLYEKTRKLNFVKFLGDIE